MNALVDRRGHKPVAELARDRPHGDRLRSMAGCRCDACRQANGRYERERQAARKAGDWNGCVPASKARAHLAALSAAGVGRRTVGDVCGVADVVLVEVIAGRKTNIRARTERAILAVTEQAAADRAYIDGASTWRMLDELLADGYSKATLARELGYQRPALQLRRDRVTARNAYEVARMYARLRFCPARETLALLRDLSEEGFHKQRVHRWLEALAAKRQLPPPDLTVRRDRILASTADLVRELHLQLTSEAMA